MNNKQRKEELQLKIIECMDIIELSQDSEEIIIYQNELYELLEEYRMSWRFGFLVIEVIIDTIILKYHL